MANFGDFSPPNFSKRCENNLKYSEILVLVELQRICNNHDYHITFTLMAHLQRVDFLTILTISSQIDRPEDDAIAKF